MQLGEFLRSKGYEYTPKLDGSFERFELGGKENRGWLVGSEYSASFGNWATGEKHFWNIQMERDLTPEEQAKLTQDIEKNKQKYAEEKLATQKEAAQKAQYIWSKCAPCESHPYLTKKQVKSYGLRISSTGDLVIPIYNKGELVSLQFIDDKGTKRFLPGGKLSGSYQILGGSARGELYLCEGYATGASIFEALEKNNAQVVLAFNAGNLPKVAEYFHATNPERKIVVCADNDESNVGQQYAQEAAKLTGGRVVIPPTTGQDFNDLHTTKGIKAVSETLQATSKTSTTEPKEVDFKNVPKITFMGGKKKDTPTRPPQELLARGLFEYFGNNLIRHDDDLFYWVGTHWEHQFGLKSPKEVKHRLRRMLQEASQNFGDNSYLNDCYQMFLSMVPTTRHNMFAPNPFATSFLDGTVWVNPKTFEVTFQEHKREDALTRILPFKWTGGHRPSAKLLEYLDKTFEGSPDKAEKIRALQQMAGACLIPCFPHVFFLFGPPGSSKSTIAKLCGLMVTPRYRSRVQPRDMAGRFGMQPMINKLVNIHTELSSTLIDDSIIKMIEDREPVNVERKGIASVDAYIPSLHIYCCNKMPRSLEGDTNAYGRRVTLLEFQNQLKEVQEGKHIRDYEQVIFDSDPEGVFAWAKEGLIDLVKNKGIYVVPQSGKDAAKKWNAESDQFVQFMESLDAGEIGDVGCEIMRCGQGAIQAKILHEAFLKYCRETRKPYPLSRNKLYDKMRENGFVDFLNQDKILYFRGLKVRGSQKTPGNLETPAGNTGASSTGF